MTNPPRGHRITLEQAQAMLRRRPPGLAPRGGHFPREVIDGILAQPGCKALRFYFGTNPDGSLAVVLVGVDEKDRDMATGDIIDNHYPCPPFCDEGSSLSS